MPEVSIRLATADDLPAINDIYNHYVLQTTCTYQEEPEAIESRRAWFAAHDQRYPVTVATVDGLVVGWGSLSRFHPRSAYRFTVENSIYLHHDRRRQGIGSALLRDQIDRATRLGHRSIIATVDAAQAGSIALHARYGFEPVAHLKHVGFKFGQWLDVVYLQRML